jgi:hypothetical protein
VITTLVTAMYAARNIAGANHDVRNVNVDQESHEEVKRPAGGDRLVPQRLDDGV